MNQVTRPPLTATAQVELGELLLPEFRLARRDTDAGYVDVLGERDPVGPHRGQQVFRSRALPLVYERFWRPAVGRYFLGRRLKAAQERQITMDMLAIEPGDRVIDVGCGTGNYTRHLARAAGSGLVVGVDASGTMLTAAAKRGGGANLAYLRADAGELPFADGEFDVVCSVGVVHMVENPMRSVRELARILAPGGRMAVVASCGEGPSPQVRQGLTTFGRDELTGALAEHGLTDIEQRVVRRGQFVSARRAV